MGEDGCGMVGKMTERRSRETAYFYILCHIAPSNQVIFYVDNSNRHTFLHMFELPNYADSVFDRIGLAQQNIVNAICLRMCKGGFVFNPCNDD